MNGSLLTQVIGLLKLMRPFVNTSLQIETFCLKRLAELAYQRLYELSTRQPLPLARLARW